MMQCRYCQGTMYLQEGGFYCATCKHVSDPGCQCDKCTQAKAADNEERLQSLRRLIDADVAAICSIYPTVGRALYAEPRERLVARIAGRVNRILEEAIQNG